MKAARLTAASAHHLRDGERPEAPGICALLADTLVILSSPSLIYAVPVSCSYTTYRYVVKHGLYDV
jgi:hypothetical protein